MTEAPPREPASPPSVLRRSREGRFLMGVCAGLGRHTGIDPVVFRVGFVILLFGSGIGIFLYIAAYLLMKEPNGRPGLIEQWTHRDFDADTVMALMTAVLALGLGINLSTVWLDTGTLVAGLFLAIALLAAHAHGVDLLGLIRSMPERLNRRPPPSHLGAYHQAPRVAPYPPSAPTAPHRPPGFRPYGPSPAAHPGRAENQPRPGMGHPSESASHPGIGRTDEDVPRPEDRRTSEDDARRSAGEHGGSGRAVPLAGAAASAVHAQVSPSKDDLPGTDPDTAEAGPADQRNESYVRSETPGPRTPGPAAADADPAGSGETRSSEVGTAGEARDAVAETAGQAGDVEAGFRGEPLEEGRARGGSSETGAERAAGAWEDEVRPYGVREFGGTREYRPLTGSREHPAGPFAPHGPYQPLDPARRRDGYSPYDPALFGPPPAPRPQRRPRPKSYIGAITLLMATILGGILVAVQAASPSGVQPTIIGGAVLVTIGAGLLIAAWWGKGAGLVAAGTMVATLVGMGLIADKLPTKMGASVWVPTTVEETRRVFDVGLGDGELDLSELVLEPGSTLRVDAKLAVGTLEVITPPEVRLEVHAFNRVGDIQVGESLRGGVDVRVDKVLEPEVPPKGEPATIVLTIKSGAGDVEVRRAP